MADGLSFRIDFDPRQMRAAILQDLAGKLSKSFRESSLKIREGVGVIVAEAIRKSPEYESLLNGRLRNELGVVNPQPILVAVVQNIQNGVFVTSLGATVRGDNIEGGIRIEILKGDYSEVLSVAGVDFTSEKGFNIPWLRWLTLSGDAVLVEDFRFRAGFGDYSRTDDGLMLPKGTWRVPPEFSGTEQSNWITRSIDLTLPAIEKVIIEEVTRRL